MTNYDEYNKHSISIAYEHAINVSLQLVTYIPLWLLYKISTCLTGQNSSMTNFIYKLSLYSLKNIITEASTTLGHLPIFNNVGYYIFKDTAIPDQNSHPYTKEMYNKKLDFANKFIPLASWWFVVEELMLHKMLGPIYTQLDMINSGLKVIAYSYATDSFKTSDTTDHKDLINLYNIPLNFESQITLSLLTPAILLKLLTLKTNLGSVTEYINQGFEIEVGDLYFEFTTAISKTLVNHYVSRTSVPIDNIDVNSHNISHSYHVNSSSNTENNLEGGYFMYKESNKCSSNDAIKLVALNYNSSLANDAHF